MWDKYLSSSGKGFTAKVAIRQSSVGALGHLVGRDGKNLLHGSPTSPTVSDEKRAASLLAVAGGKGKCLGCIVRDVGVVVWLVELPQGAF